MNKEKKDRPSIEAPQAVKHPDKHPPCYRSETRNPYPLCLGWGMKACAHCCLWTDYDSDEDESRVNLPLSLAQLQEMDGTPAWWECGPEYSCWGIIAVDSSGRWEGIPFFQGRWREVNFVSIPGILSGLLMDAEPCRSDPKLVRQVAERGKLLVQVGKLAL